MKRKEFIKGAGLAGLGLTIPSSKSALLTKHKAEGGDCPIVPTETAGPFDLDLSENNFYLRQNISEDRNGTTLDLKMRIIGSENCEPMQNVRVNIWHCDKDGNYSGYKTEKGLTYLRGYQFTDANGMVEFTTKFPGWYPGRVCHFHFQVYVSASYAAISQFTFDHDAVNSLYNAFPEIYTKGEDPVTPETDFSFMDGYDLQKASLTRNEETGNYDSFIEVAVQGAGTVGTGYIESQIDKVFELGQNSPNPYSNYTSIPVKLKTSANLKLELYNVNGEKLLTIMDEHKLPGNYSIDIDFASYNIPPGNYIYQLEAKNEMGVFVLPKMMTQA